MRIALAFMAGIIVGILLALASGSLVMQRVSDWSALLRTELSARMSSLDLQQGGSSAIIRPPDKPSPPSRLRWPVTRMVRMAKSNLVLSQPPSEAPHVSGTTTYVAAALEVLPSGPGNASDVSLSVLSTSVKTESLTKKTIELVASENSSATPVAVSGPRERTSPVKTPEIKARAMTPKDEYAQALKNYQSGLYSLAREQFAAFMKAFPGHSLVPNALYWSGETWYAEDRYEHAAELFAQVVREHPGHAKSPDALLKLAYSAMRQGLPDQAGAYLLQLESRYPDSPASRLGRQARSRLQGDNSSGGTVLARG
jgi:tol-pal system protein YbgF